MKDRLDRGMARYFAMGVITQTVLAEVNHRPLLKQRLAMRAIDRAYELGDVAITREVCAILRI